MSRTVTVTELAQPLTSFEAAVDQVVRSIRPLPSQMVELDQANGLVLAQDIVAGFDIPSEPSSTMDGYAIKSAESSQLIFNFEKVMTGWPVPDGFDAVVPWERVTRADNGIVLSEPVARGEFIRPTGETIAAGCVVLQAGAHIDTVEIGLLASLGLHSVEAIPRSRIAILATGDELMSDAPNKTHDADTPMLRSWLTRRGATVATSSVLRDDLDAITDWLKEAATQVDAIITCGGASVGEYDWIRHAIEDLGTLNLWRVALKPGKPFAFGEIAETPVFVIPGNPASVLACAHAFVAPAIAKMMARPLDRITTEVTISADVKAPPDRTFLCPVRVSDGVATPAEARTSSTLQNHIGMNAYAVIDAGGVTAGSQVVIEFMK